MTVFVKNTNFQRNHIFSEEESTVLRGGQGGGGGGFGTSPFIESNRLILCSPIRMCASIRKIEQHIYQPLVYIIFC